MRQITLKNRITIILTVFTILTIGVFIAVQLYHELKMVVQYNFYKAKMTSVVIEEKMEKILSLEVPADQKIAYLDKMLNSFKETQLIEKAYIFDKNADVVSTTEKWLKGGGLSHGDFNIVEKLVNGEFQKQEVDLDLSNKILSIYIPLDQDKEVKSVVRIFFPLGDVWLALNQVYQPAIAVGLSLVLVNIFLGFFLSRLIIGPIRMFNLAAKTIAAGDLNSKVRVYTNDELEELAETFNSMTIELQKMKERAENANPLTKLPGNIMIREAVEKGLKENKKFAVIYSDLDNFKAFNDKYGIAKGDEAIKITSDILKESIKLKGSPEDFVGHEGGDDFIIVTTPVRAQEVADYICGEFDKRIVALYSQEDLEKGHIMALSRDGTVKKFPIMTISLAGVSNEYREINSYAEVTNIAAEVKKKAKREEKSCFILDKRQLG